MEAHLQEIPRRGLIVTYCTRAQEHSSARAAQTLLQHGWTDVPPLLGGFEAWRKAGYPTEAKTARTPELSEASGKRR